MTVSGRGDLFVVDTNVIVAGLLTSRVEAPTARVLDALARGRLPCLLSQDLLVEWREVLMRPRIVALHGLRDEEIDAVLTEIVFHARLQDPEPGAEEAPDPGDQHLWDLLCCEAGAVLVTGDRRLLEEAGNPFRIVSPAEITR